MALPSADEAATVALPSATTIRDALSQHPPHSAAVCDAEGAQVTYGEVLSFIDGPGRLNVKADDTVMYIVEDGALSAMTFLAVALYAQAAPISTSCPRAEMLAATLAFRPRICLTTAAHAQSVGTV